MQSIADLTDPPQLQLLGVSLQELTGAWRWYNTHNMLALTQKLGAALFNVPNLEGFLSPSAKSPGEKNLNAFPTKLRKGSLVHFLNPLTKKAHTLKGK